MNKGVKGRGKKFRWLRRTVELKSTVMGGLDRGGGAEKFKNVTKHLTRTMGNFGRGGDYWPGNNRRKKGGVSRCEALSLIVAGG